MDNYDEEDDEIELFSSGQGDLYYQSNEMDPYLKNTDVNYDSEDLDDLTIRPTDSLIICATIKDNVNYLEVYVHEEYGNGTHNMCLRHDIIIYEFPLIVLSKEGTKLSGQWTPRSRYGILTFYVNVKLSFDDVYICFINHETSDCHTDSVIGLAWNKEFRNMVASASADKKVKVWDVATGKCKVTMEHHKKEVHAVAWNYYTPEVLLSGSRDRTVVVKDGRDPSHSGLKWSTKAKVENLAWDPHSEHSFVLLATGSGDESVKLWDLSNNQPSWIATHKPNAVRAMNKYFSFTKGKCFKLTMQSGGLPWLSGSFFKSSRISAYLPSYKNEKLNSKLMIWPKPVPLSSNYGKKLTLHLGIS